MEFHKILIRLPQETFDKLVELAKKNGISANAFVNLSVSEKIEKESKSED